MRRLMFLLILLAMGSSRPAVADLVLRTIDGRRVVAKTLRIDGDAFVIDAADSTARIAIDDVVSADTVGAKLEPVDSNAEVLLADGSRVIGRLLPGDEDRIRIETASLGELRLSIDVIRAVSIGSPEIRVDPASFPPAAESDVVYRRGPVEGDRVRGTLTQIGTAGVSIESQLGEITLELDSVLGFSVVPFDSEWTPPKRRVELELAGGGVVIGDLNDLSSGRIRVDTLFRRDLVVPFTHLERVRFSGDRFVYLSDLEPSGVEQTPFLGGSDDFLFPWRRDRTVTGELLQVGGERFGKGLGVHSRTVLRYGLNGTFARLEAFTGIADEVLELETTGAAVLRVVVDGETRFESPELVAGAAPHVVSVDLSGAMELSIEVDFGAHGDVGDRVVIGDPVLIRA